ncbi:MAG TPA: glycosyltransferase [Thermoanaerobaculia bacterium]|nr:glycosyltransferase [Thermoanaerobaculia bacterium]
MQFAATACFQERTIRALLRAVGTRGDAQPALALALELRKLGASVRLGVSPNFALAETPNPAHLGPGRHPIRTPGGQ